MALDPARPGGPRRGLPARRGRARQDWSRYWRSGNQPIEAMHAHFSGHVYHRHSHDGYSFGVTEEGAQAFGCRNAQHVSGRDDHDVQIPMTRTTGTPSPRTGSPTG